MYLLHYMYEKKSGIRLAKNIYYVEHRDLYIIL